MSEYLWTLKNRPPRFVILDNTRKNRPKTFLHWKDYFFQKFAFSATFWLLKKWSYNLHHSCQNTLWILTKFHLMSAIVGKLRIKWPKSLFLRDDGLCFEKFGSRLLRSWRNELITCTMIDRKHCGRMRDKTADFRVGQNSQFAKRDKIADFDNETRPPILEWDKITDS